jgi:hypothetical protein
MADTGSVRPSVEGVTGAVDDVIAVPPGVLLRHGLRILDPATAVVAPGRPRPRPTVYCANTLQIPQVVLGTAALQTELDAALRDIHLRVAPPAAIEQVTGGGMLAVELVPLERGKPTVVDAWVALQHIYAATVDGGALAGLADGIRLEHAYVSDFLEEQGGPYEGSVPPMGLLPYLRPYGGRPMPVQVPLTRPPTRRPVSDAMPRRPVVALLDTGIREHPWLDWPPDKYRDRAGDWFVLDVPDLQKEIAEQGRRNPAGGLPINGVEDERVAMRPAVGLVESHLGHGTFVAGIIRKAAPDASVLTIRVMHSTGIAHDRDVVCALRGIVERVRAAQDPSRPEPGLMVDVVLMPFGCFEEHDNLDPATSELARLVYELDSLGVAVIASAGNSATDRPFFPAALATGPAPVAGPGVASVGALNPDGSIALFSNFGSWVRYWRDGASMVSTYPIDVQGPAQPPVEMPANGAGHTELPPRRAFDPDDFTSGFAVWHGTSFAAPILAAELCNALIDLSVRDPRYRLDRVDVATTRTRARTVMAARKVVNGDVGR